MKTLGELESTEQTHGLFLRCVGERRGSANVIASASVFHLFPPQTVPFPPWSPLTELSNSGGQTSEASSEALPGGHR